LKILLCSDSNDPEIKNMEERLIMTEKRKKEYSPEELERFEERVKK
jgi:hypothetical protein